MTCNDCVNILRFGGRGGKLSLWRGNDFWNAAGFPKTSPGQGNIEQIPEGRSGFSALSVLRVARIFGDARVVQDLHGGGVAEVLPVLQDPGDLLVRGDFDELRAFAGATAGG